MTITRPPRFAAWMLKHLGSSPNNDAVLGDLEERYQVRQRPAWYWYQAFAAIWASFASEVWTHKLQAFTALLIGWSGLISIWFVLEFMIGNPFEWKRHVCIFVWFIAGSCSGCVVAFSSKQLSRPMVILFSASIVLFLLGLHGKPSKANLVEFWIDVAVLTFSVSFAGLWASSPVQSAVLQKEKT